MPQPRRIPIVAGVLLVTVLSLSACGGGGGGGDTLGGGGCGGGATVTGVVVCADQVLPFYNQANTNQVDVVQNSSHCTPPQIEFYSDHSANVTLSATLAQGATQPPSSTSIVFTQYTISYTAIPTPGSFTPAIASIGPIFDTITVTVPPSGSGTTTRTVALLNLRQKQIFVNDLGQGGFFDGVQRNYSLTYTFTGFDQRGDQVIARGFTQVFLSSYVYPCV